MIKKTFVLIWMIIILMAIGACNFPVKVSPTPTIFEDDSNTPTPTSTPMPTPTDLPTPTPTAIPSQSIDLGKKALFYGDWDSAYNAFLTARENSTEADTYIVATLGLGRAQYLRGELSAGLNTFRSLVENYTEGDLIPDVYYHMASILMDLQRYSEASDAYKRYLDLRPDVITSYIEEFRGNALLASGDYLQAFDTFQNAQKNPRIGSKTPLQIKSAQALAQNGDYETALALYEQIYNTSANDLEKAEINWLRGQLYTNLGEDGLAHIYYFESVENFPMSYYTYLGLIELVESGVPVNEYDRGLIDYYATQYSLSAAAFDRYISTTPQHLSEAHYYKGLALREIGSYEAAIQAWDELIQQHTSTEKEWDNAWEEKGYTQWAYLDQYDAAINTFLSFAAQLPDHPRAPDFVFYAAQVAERNNQLQMAADLWNRVDTEYPFYSNAFRARFLTGITYFRLGNFSAAQQNFQQAFEKASSPTDLSASSLWIGKCQLAQNDIDGAKATWNYTSTIDPTGYYSERARDLFLDRGSFSPPQMYDFVVDFKNEKSKAEEWINSTFQSSPHDEQALNWLLSDSRIIRGTELWKLGLYELARTEFEDLRSSITEDPVKNYLLSNFLVDLGLYRTAIFSARQVLNVAALSDAGTLGAPSYFNYIRFGTYFDDLVIPLANEYGFHPLLVFSLIRQESLFEGFVRSSAGARGLMQIIPSTGESIHNSLGWPPAYTDNDLYRPIVNLRFGIKYLSDQVSYLNNDIYAGLAAYNGGPGNAKIWMDLSGNDPDLFLEIIRFEETRRYIRGIYEIFSIYRLLYNRSP